MDKLGLPVPLRSQRLGRRVCQAYMREYDILWLIRSLSIKHMVYSAAGAVVDVNLSGADVETLDATYKENVKEYALRIPYVSAAGLRSMVEFRAETAAEVKRLALDRMVDNSLLQEIQKEMTNRERS
jgi:hypothetical protein